jgi:hypothetical protein
MDLWTGSASAPATRRVGWSPGAAGRRVGYAGAIIVGLLLLGLLNVWPGWWTVPFLTAETEQVLGIVNLSLWVGVITNAVLLFIDRRWLKAAVNTVSTAVGLVATVVIWQVFPFDFSDWWFDATVLVRVLLILGIIGSVIGIVFAIGTLMRELVRMGTRTPE